MRALMLACVSLLGITSAVLGADFPRRMTGPIAGPPANSWTGFYVGLNGGGGIANTTSDFDVGGVPFASVKNSLTGWLGGGQIGFNWQAGPAVFGVEADFQASDVDGTLSTPCPGVPCIIPVTASFTQRIPWFGTARGRLGFATPAWMIYATGGYAFAQVDTDASASAPGFAATLSQSEFRNGWTVGGGMEVKLAPNWSAKLEYLYLDFGSQNVAWALTGLPTINDSSKITANVVRAGVNYKF